MATDDEEDLGGGPLLKRGPAPSGAPPGARPDVPVLTELEGGIVGLSYVGASPGSLGGEVGDCEIVEGGVQEGLERMASAAGVQVDGESR